MLNDMSAWAACLLTGRASDIAALRLLPNVEFAEVGGAFWLRGSKLDEDLEHELKKIPGLSRFALLSSDRLRPVGSRIPDRTLPPGVWRPIKQAVLGTLPVAALCGESSQKVPVGLIRTSEEQAAFALLLGLQQWVEYASCAAQVRLAPLRFAAAEHREVLVLGNLLPALPGRHYAGKEGILVPCGFTWTPQVEAGVLRQLFDLEARDFVILGEDNTHQVIHSEQFVPASRSAARLTLKEWDHA